MAKSYDLLMIGDDDRPPQLGHRLQALGGEVAAIWPMAADQSIAVGAEAYRRVLAADGFER